MFIIDVNDIDNGGCQVVVFHLDRVTKIRKEIFRSSPVAASRLTDWSWNDQPDEKRSAMVAAYNAALDRIPVGTVIRWREWSEPQLVKSRLKWAGHTETGQKWMRVV